MADRAPLPRRGDEEVRQEPVLRRPRSSDVDALVGLRANTDVRMFLGGPVTGRTALEKAEALIGSDLHFVVEAASGDVAGLVSVTPRASDMELSYEFFPDYWGTGLARAACETLLESVVAAEPARLVAITQWSNETSRRLLGSLGFTAEAEFEEFGAAQVLYVRSR